MSKGILGTFVMGLCFVFGASVAYASQCTAVYTNHQGNTYLECSDGWCGFHNEGWGGGYHQTVCYRGIYKKANTKKTKKVNKDVLCNNKYPGTIYRASDDMCICPSGNPMGWNKATHCSNI